MPRIWFHTLSVEFRLAIIYITLTCMSNIHHDTEAHHINVFYFHIACYISIPQRLLVSPLHGSVWSQPWPLHASTVFRYGKMDLERLVNMYVYAQMEDNVNVTQNIHTMCCVMYVYAQMEDNVNVTQNIHTMCCVILTTITIRVDITMRMYRYLFMLIYIKNVATIMFLNSYY